MEFGPIKFLGILLTTSLLPGSLDKNGIYQKYLDGVQTLLDSLAMSLPNRECYKQNCFYRIFFKKIKDAFQIFSGVARGGWVDFEKN